MWKQISTIGAITAALAAAPALAQQSPDGSSKSPMAQEKPETGQPQSGQSAAPKTDQGAEADKGAQADKSMRTGELAGQSVYSSDGEELGEVAKVNKGPDGDIENIHVDIGSFLGMGGKTVKIGPEQFTQANGRIELSLTAEEAEALPEVKAE